MIRKPLDKLTETERVKLVQDKVDEILGVVDRMTKTHVYVGVPESSDSRGEDIGNAALAYIHNYGSYRAHIPARPFMEPGIERVQGTIVKEFMQAARAALTGDQRKTNAHFVAAGFAASSSIKDVIRAGIPPPIKESSVRARARARGTKTHSSEFDYAKALSEGASAQELMSIATPLINTGKLLNSITFVITYER